VTVLPQALAGWRPLLAIFDQSVIAALAPMLDRLARAIGPMSPDASEATGDPAGYDGVATRGPYERLLPSEWLLADELPDEFLRRAVSSEHLFFALARQRPRGRRAMTVLVDAGPELLGTPRIGALASLLVLARRANDAKASFGWRPAQADNNGGLADLEPAGIRTFLETFASSPVDDDALRDVAHDGPAESELWVITGARGGRAAEAIGASVVAIEDVLELGARELAVRVHAPGRPDRVVRLPLPEDTTCVRVLREPFPQRTPPAVRAGKARAPLAVARPLVSPGGPRVFARLEDGGLLVLPLPRSKRQDIGSGRILRLEAAGEIVAAGHPRGKPAVIAQNESDLTFASWRSKRGVLRRLGRCNEMLRPAPLDGRVFPLIATKASTHFIGRGGRLLEFRPGNRVAILAQDCCALLRHGDGIVFADGGHSSTHLRFMRGPYDPASPPRAWLELRADRVHLAPTAVGWIVCAYQDRDESWIAATIEGRTIATGQHAHPTPVLLEPSTPRTVRVVRVEVPRSAEVVGVLDHHAPETSNGRRSTISLPALLLLEEEGRKLRVTSGGKGPEFSVALPVRAEHVVVDPITRVAVCVSSTAEIVLVALEWRSVVARLTSAGRIA